MQYTINEFDDLVDDTIERIKELDDNKKYILRLYGANGVIINPDIYRFVYLTAGSEIDSVDLTQLVNAEYLDIYGDITIMPQIDYSKLRRLHIGSKRKWKDLAKLQYNSLEELSISVYPDEEPIDLHADQLKCIRINASGNESVKKYTIDLSCYPMLESVFFCGYDYIESIEINGIDRIKAIYIERCGGINDPSWLYHATQLENLVIRGTKLEEGLCFDVFTRLTKLEMVNAGIESIEKLRIPSSIEDVNFLSNKIRDLSPLYKMPKLKRVKVNKNLLDLTDRSLISANELIFNDYDDAIDRCMRDAYNQIETICRSVLNEEKKAKEIRDGVGEKNILDVGLIGKLDIPIEDRVRRSFQRYFSWYIRKIDPWNTNLDQIIYTHAFKKDYINRMMYKYPFLKLEDNDIKQLEREEARIFDDKDIKQKERYIVKTFADQENKLVCIYDKNIYSIYVKSQPGYGKLSFSSVISNEDSAFRTRLSKSTLFLENSLAMYNYSIVIEKKYDIDSGPFCGLECYDFEKLFYQILIAMILSTRSIVLNKTILMAEFEKTGKIVQRKVSKKDLMVAKNEGAEQVIIAGPCSLYEDMDLEKIGLQYMYVNDANDIISILIDSAEDNKISDIDATQSTDEAKPVSFEDLEKLFSITYDADET